MIRNFHYLSLEGKIIILEGNVFIKLILMSDNILALSSYKADFFSHNTVFPHRYFNVAVLLFSSAYFNWIDVILWEAQPKISMRMMSSCSHCLHHQWGKWPWEDRFLFQVEYGAYCHLRGTTAETVICHCFSLS